MTSESAQIPQFADRRTALRQTCRVEHLTVDHATAGTMVARVLDLSREGFRLLLPVAVPCGDEILLHPPAGMDLLKIRATIVRQGLTTRDGARMFDCGVEVADTAGWRKHNWFLKLRIGSEEYEAAQHQSGDGAAA